MKHSNLASLWYSELKRAARAKFPEGLLFDDTNLTGIRKEIFQRATVVAYVTFFLGVIIVFRTVYIVIIYRYKYGLFQADIRNFLELDSYRLIATSAVLSLGYFLFRLKKKRQILYGLIETGFAVSTTYTIVDNLQKVLIRGKTDILVFFPIMTSIYLIVRGLSNVSDGMKKSSKKAAKAIVLSDKSAQSGK